MFSIGENEFWTGMVTPCYTLAIQIRPLNNFSYFISTLVRRGQRYESNKK